MGCIMIQIRKVFESRSYFHIPTIRAFAKKLDYVRHRGIGEPPLTPIRRIYVLPGEYLTPINVSKTAVIKQQVKPSVLNIRRAIRPPKDSYGATYCLTDRTNKHMNAYLTYLESDSKEERDIENGVIYETARFFKNLEDHTKWTEIQAIEACGYCINFPNLSCVTPKAKGNIWSWESIKLISEKMYHGNEPSKILDADKGQMEKLDPEDEAVKILLDHVLGNCILYVTDSWAPVVPFTEVDKIYIVWLANDHFYPFVIDLVKCEVWISDSISNNTNEGQRGNRYNKILCLRRILPAILQLSGFYDVRKDLKPVFREWDLNFANKEQCFTQTDGVSCRPFSLKMMEVLISRRALSNITQKNMNFIRRGIVERIFTYSKPPPK
ncbi:hypothetical protein CASFOL_007617 [Castilleja foliolosa]|uniref:Ubiquitin-like protease family profile domain-containing protein n=1 Tax=Castilleja foliolosa TaxID=1961234 RepID=A0ABD3E100_9LAMI